MMAANTHPVKSETNIHEIVEYVVSIISAESSRNLNIQKDYDPSIPSIFADREQLIQAVLNLFFYSRQLALFVGRRLMITWLFKVKVIGIYIVIRHPLPIHTSRCHDHNLAVNIDFDNFYLNVNRDNKLLGF